MKKTLTILILAWMPWMLLLTMGAWDNTLPADNTVWNAAPGFIRNNWDAIEVALGVGISMEGSASPWYQSAAPTTTADGSTALAAANNGLLWLDSDNRVLNTYINGTGFVGVDSIPNVVTFTASDQTPTVLVGRTFITDSGTLRIADFDDGTAGKVITVQSAGAITFDTTTAVNDSNNLDGSSVDIVTASGDVTVWETSNGTTWKLVSFLDGSTDQTVFTDLTTKTYVDAQVAAAGTITTSGATVFNTTLTAGTTFQDLDLSGTVGSNSAQIWVEVTISGGPVAVTTYIMRTKGYGAGTWAQSYGAHSDFNTMYGGGGIIADGTDASPAGIITMLTDSSGVVEHGLTNNTKTVTIKLIAYSL